MIWKHRNKLTNFNLFGATKLDCDGHFGMKSSYRELKKDFFMSIQHNFVHFISLMNKTSYKL